MSDRASSVSILKRPGVKRVRRILVLAVVLASAVYFVPIPTLILVACGLIDVGRHKKIRYELIEKYFMGNGLGTWLLSPINLLADLFSYSNKGKYKLEDLPAGHRAEIESCVRAFVENGNLIKDHIAKTIGQNKRCMLTFKIWSRSIAETSSSKSMIRPTIGWIIRCLSSMTRCSTARSTMWITSGTACSWISSVPTIRRRGSISP